MQTTFEAKLAVSDFDLSVLHAHAEELCRLERKLFVDIYIRKANRNELKRHYIADYGITGRQFNALRVNVDGKVKAWEECEKRNIETLTGKKKATEKKIKKLQSDRGKAKTQRRKDSLKFSIHQKKRKVGNLQHRIDHHKQRLAGAPSICFGGRDLFAQQFELAQNGYVDHAEWLQAFRGKRANQFFNLGSKDETRGCQTCQYDGEAKTLKIRLARAGTALNGDNEWLSIENVSLPRGAEQIAEVQAFGGAVTTRIVLREDRQGKAAAYALVSVDEILPAERVYRNRSAIGVDLNANSVALALIDRFGNPVGTETLPFDLTRKSSGQVESILSSLAQEIVMRACAHHVPIVLEELDFADKKKTLGEVGRRYAEMLSGFAYSTFFKLVTRCAARRGVKVITIDPGFTSVLGWVKFGVDRMTVDEAAAVAIARRGQGFRERLRSRAMAPALRRSLMQASGETHMRHVWSGWRRFYSWLGRNRKVWSGRCSAKERAARATSTTKSAKRQDIGVAKAGSVKSAARAGEIPAVSPSCRSPGEAIQPVIRFG